MRLVITLLQVSDRKVQSRSQVAKAATGDGPHWDRLKISMLANRPPTPEVGRHGAQNLPLQTRYQTKPEAQSLLGSITDLQS